MYSSSDDDSNDGHRRPRSGGGGNNNNNNGNSNSNRKQRKAAAAAAAATAAVEQEILRQLASLQLPHMEHSIPNRHHQASYYPNYPDITGGSMRQRQQQEQQQEQQEEDPPTIRILVVSDIDLASASALAESALTSEELHRVDLCIACGPFCREEDLKPYYQGRQRRRHMARYGHHHHPTLNTNSSSTSSVSSPYSRMNMIPPMPQHNYATTAPSTNNYDSIANNGADTNYPFRRTKEETAALEGLMTAALSQLESIVCRVIFVPGKTDPMTTICTSAASGGDDDDFGNSTSSNIAYTKERRLTPNSRNIHQQWMPLCPGLGCTGLLHLDWQKLKQQYPPPLEDGGELDDEDDDEDDEDDSDSELPEDSSFSFNNNCDHLGGGEGGDNEVDDTTNFNSSSASLNSPTPPHLTPHSFSVDDDDAGILDGEDETNHELTETERAEQYGMEFVDHLEKLVQLAPPVSAVTELPPSSVGGFQSSHSSISGLLNTKLFQSILVTHFHHLEKDFTTSYGDDTDDDNNNNNGIIYNTDSRSNQQQPRRTTTSATVSPTTSGGKQYHRRPYPNPPLYSTDHTNVTATSEVIGSSSTSTETNVDDSNNTVAADDTKPSPPPPPPPYAEATGESEQQQQDGDESFKASPSSPLFVDDPPWPTEQHEKFCSLPIIQEHVILEIAAGRNSNGNTLPAKEFLQGNIQIILPGSLRERGEFCLIDVAFMKGTGGGVGAGGGVAGTTPMSPMRNHVVHRHQHSRGSAGTESNSSSNSNNDDCRWRVRRTRFHTISDYV